jgi:cysteine desulfurase
MDPIYLDYAATTPVRAEVRAAMEPYLDQRFGNPSSTHRWGREAQAALEESRSRIAEVLGARRREIVFVRGGTESDNLAILGRADHLDAEGACPHVVTCATEHKAVLDTVRAVERRGGRATVLDVDHRGTLSLDALDAALAEAPCVASLMWVNNEVGVVHPMAEIAARTRARGVPLHSDAVQAVGKVRVRVDEVAVDVLSLSGHKLHGPKGTGALFVREGTELHARIHGGGQEMGLRPGTQDVAGAVGLAEAVELAVAEQQDTAARLTSLRELLEGRLRATVPGLRIHGHGAPRAPHVLNVGVPEVDPELLLVSLDMAGLAVSGGSACSSGGTGGSHVLQALYGAAPVPAAIRFSFARETTVEEVERAADVTLATLRRLAPRAVAT